MYEIPPAKYGAEYILKILLNPKIDKQKICHQKPCNITKSSTFVVDVLSLQHPDDIKKDEFGIWNYSGSHPQAYKVYNERRTGTLLLRNVVVVQQGPVWCILDACTVLTHLIQSLNG